MGLTAKVVSSYRKEGRKLFLYVVRGTTAEKDQFIAAKKAAYPASEHVFTDGPNAGQPLHVVSEYINGQKQLIKPVIKLTITTNNKVVEDDTDEMIATDELIRQAMIGEMAKVMVAQRMGGVRVATTQTAAPKIQSPEELDVETIEQGGTEPAVSLAGAAVAAGAETIDQ